MNAKIGKNCRQGLNRETKAHYLAKGHAALNPTSETAARDAVELTRLYGCPRIGLFPF